MAAESSAEGLATYRAAGVSVVSVNIGDSDVPFERQMRLAACFRSHVRRHPDDYRMVSSAAEVDAAHDDGVLGVVFDVEGAFAVDGLDLVDVYRQVGVRTFALVYNLANGVGGGCHDAVDDGLTAFGRSFVRELQAAGIVVDCSHTGYRTAREAIDMAEAPVVFSHSNPRALVDHPRNIPDDLIRACASTGGFVGINGVSGFLDDPRSRPETIAEHVDHVVQLVGPEHVALGLDHVVSMDDLTDNFAASPAFWPQGFGYGPHMWFAGPDCVPGVAAALRMRGYDEPAVAAVLGGNQRRVAAAVWR